MIKRAIAVLGVFAALGAAPAAADEVGEESNLWSRAVVAATRATNVVASTIVVTFHGQDPDTGVKCRREGTLTLRGFDEDGVPDWHVVYTEDLLGRVPKEGVDCRYGPAAQGELELSFECSPLNGWVQRRVSYESVGELREVGGTDCVVHEFTWKRSCHARKSVLGEVCIDPLSAQPLEVRYRLKRPPRGYRSVEFVLAYEDLGNLGPNVVRFEVDALPKGRNENVEPFRFAGKLTGHRRVGAEQHAGEGPD